MRTYDKYKNSGIEWIGEIPDHWEVKKLKFIGNFTASGIDKKIEPNEPLVQIINYTDVYGNLSHSLVKKDYMFVSATESKIKEHQVIIGDLLFTPSSETIQDIGISALVVEELPNTAYSYHILRFRFRKKIYLNYRKYLCNNHYVLNYFSSSAEGTTRKILNRDDFNNTIVVLPSFKEQTAIANYLDSKTTEIDQTIADKEALINLFEEEKKALINEAVTKGLNPTVQLKPSGIDWLGDIPEHWEVKKLKYVAINRPSNVDKKSKEDEREILLCNYVDVYKNDSITSDIEFMKATASESQIENFRLQKGDVIATKDSETPDDIAVPAYVEEDFKDVICGYHLTHIKPLPNFMIGKYLFRLLQTNYTREYFSALARGVTRYALNTSSFSEMPTLLPPIKEQTTIVQYIETETFNINEKIKLTKQEIELLKEYRQALIFEAVTGKIKVFEDE